MTSPASPGEPTAQSLRVLALALCVSPLFIVVAVVFVLPTDASTAPPVAVTAGILALVAITTLLAEAVGYRVAPLTAADAAPEQALRTSLQRFSAAMMLRFAVTEAAIFVGLALSFVLDHGVWPLVVAVLAGVPAVAWEVWPHRRVVTKVAERLESGGVRSGLPEAFDVR